MMTWLIALAARRLKLAPWLAELFAGILVVCALIAVVWWQRVDAKADQRAADMLQLERARNAALRINAAALAIADAARVKDTARIVTQDKERLDAVQSAPPSRTGAATRALSCVRLRQADRDADADAAGCGR